MNLISIYPGTAILYTCIVIICFLLTWGIRPRNKTSTNNLFLFLIIIVLTMLSGFRGSTVGRDTEGYIRIINAHGEWNTITDIGFTLLVKVIQFFCGDSPQIVLFIFALLTNLIIVSVLYEYRGISNFRVSLLVYMTTFYFLTFSGIRQWLAAALISYAVSLSVKEQYKKAIIVMVVATTIHFSALISFVCIPIIMYSKKIKKTGMNSNTLLAIVLLLPVFVGGAIVVYHEVLSKYNHWLSDSYTRDGGITAMAFVHLISIVLFFLFRKSKANLKRYDYVCKNDMYTMMILSFFVHFSVSVIGSYIKNIGRIEWYFAVGYCLLVGSVFNSCHTSGKFGVLHMEKSIINIGLKSIFLFIALYEFYYMLKTGGSGQIPYVPFW